MNSKALFSLCFGILIWTGCRSEPPVLEYDVEGVVAAVHTEQGVIEVVHNDIPGYMPAMQMPFPVERPELLDGLRMGDQIRFHLTVTDGSGLMTRVDRLPGYAGPLPEFDLENLAGESVHSSTLLGRVTVVNFWASWCAPCKVEMPILARMTADYPESDFEVVGIVQDPENRQAIEDVLAELDIRYPILLTNGELETTVGGIPVIPGTLLVDRDGQVVDKRLGLFDEGELRARIESLLEPSFGL
jgi:thiol-disulfide isomerase/thioredoxin